MGSDEILPNQYPLRWLHDPFQVTQLACPSSLSLQLTPPRPDSTPPPSMPPFRPLFCS